MARRLSVLVISASTTKSNSKTFGPGIVAIDALSIGELCTMATTDVLGAAKARHNMAGLPSPKSLPSRKERSLMKINRDLKKTWREQIGGRVEILSGERFIVMLDRDCLGLGISFDHRHGILAVTVLNLVVSVF